MAKIKRLSVAVDEGIVDVINRLTIEEKRQSQT